MYIDLHCHTKKCKSGDSQKREVNKELFQRKIIEKRVGIVAITNHNQFDRKQFDEFSNNDNQFQLWPGIELDVVGEVKGHCVLIVDPKDIDLFEKVTTEMFNGTTPDEFKISITDLCTKFSDINLIALAHFGQKRPALSESDVDNLRIGFQNKKPVYIEVTNLLSAGIMIAHNYDTLIGSDVSNWDEYEKYNLPELKLPIDGFNKFLLLIKKDPEIIKTFIDQKFSEQVEISLFGDKPFNVPIYNDINVIFGGKGTGKTEILNSIKKHYIETRNTEVTCYFAHEKQSSFSKISAITCIEEDFSQICNSDLSDEFGMLRNWNEASTIPITQYREWINTKDNNENMKSFGFSKAIFNEIKSNNSYIEANRIYIEMKENSDKILSLNLINYLDFDEVITFKSLVNKMITRAKEKVIDEFCKFKALSVEEYTILEMKRISLIKSGVVSKPPGTGLLNVFNCGNLAKISSEKILTSLQLDSKKIRKKLGSLIDKGDIYLEKELSINPNILNGSSIFLRQGMGINIAKNLKSKINDVNKTANSPQLASSISALIQLMTSSNIYSLKDLFAVNGKICRDNGEKYKPSNGEESMIILNYSLLDDNKSVYILDEPEMSVGHKYINAVIVPRLRELSRMNKKVIISTHDANIAIRTLPFMSLYREDEGSSKYSSYIGNPFLDLMIEIADSPRYVRWAQISIETLEGGRNAFNERGESYGKEIN